MCSPNPNQPQRFILQLFVITVAWRERVSLQGCTSVLLCVRSMGRHAEITYSHQSANVLEVLPTRVLSLPSPVEVDKRPDEKFRQGFTGPPAAAVGSENK